MIKIEITEEIRLKAKNKVMADKPIIEEARIKKGLKHRFSTDYDKNNITGQIGELVFKSWLKHRYLDYQEQNKVGESDDFDVLLKGHKIDVKTALRIHSMDTLDRGTFKLMIHRDQVGLHGDIVFWVILNGVDPETAKYAYLVGWMKPARIKEYPVSTDFNAPCYFIPFEDVIPPEALEMIE